MEAVLTGRYVDMETGEERPGLSLAPSGYIHFSRDGRMFNVTVDSARKPPAGKRATAEEAEALVPQHHRLTGPFFVEGDKVYFDLDVSWNQSWTGTRQNAHLEARRRQALHLSRHYQPDDRQSLLRCTG